jgi:YHS domain-containing protein
MRNAIARLLLSALLVLMFVAATPASAGDHRLLATDADHVAIQGYDTVAYFTDGKAIKGSSTYEYVWDDAKWYFASAVHRDSFIAEPEHYMPRFGGFCAGAMRIRLLVPANPEAWAIVDGKLFMVAGDAKDIDQWKVNAASNIQKANEIWADVKNRQAAQQP